MQELLEQMQQAEFQEHQIHRSLVLEPHWTAIEIDKSGTDDVLTCSVLINSLLF